MKKEGKIHQKYVKRILKEKGVFCLTCMCIMDRRVNLSSANSSQILADSLLDFVKYTADMSTNSDESKLPSTLVSNLSINENGYIWKGNLPQLKRFVQNDLKLIGKWSSPGGETKLFKNTELVLNGLVKHGRSLL